MQTGRPRLTTTAAAAMVGELFGVAADDARDLGSERDQAFLVLSGKNAVAARPAEAGPVHRPCGLHDRATTVAVRDGMRDRGVLVGTTGRAGNVLKIRPPLAFTQTEVPVLVDALDRTLAEQPGR
jgi:hypothetical protein